MRWEAGPGRPSSSLESLCSRHRSRRKDCHYTHIRMRCIVLVKESVSGRSRGYGTVRDRQDIAACET